MMTRQPLLERNVPVPRGAVTKYDWSDMAVGDSRFFPAAARHPIAAAATREGKRLGHTFTTRAVPGGMRVWRTA